MAKEQFTRTKPHVNFELLRWLTQRGFTQMGAYQISHGLVVTNLADRELLAETMSKYGEEVYYKVVLTDGTIN